MASSVGQAVGSSKLPAITQSLVSPAPVSKTPTLKEQAGEWIVGVRQR